MLKKLVLLMIAVAPAALAQGLPDYYPKEGFKRTAVVTAVYPDEGRIVIGDLEYRMNSRPIVRSLSSRYDSMARIRPGAHVAFRIGENREIVEFWLLPKNYTGGRRR